MRSGFSSFLVISILFSFSSDFAEASELRKIDIENEKNIEIIYSKKITVAGSTEKLRFNQTEQTVFSFSQLQQVDQQLRAKDYANSFANDGCYAKAHLLSYELERAGIRHLKAMITGNGTGDIQVFKDAQKFLFEYHIAPLVLVKVNNEVIPYVLDFSFFDRPVTFSAWVEYFYQNSNYMALKTEIVLTSVVAKNWVLNSTSLYPIDLLYRFESEINAFKFLINKDKAKLENK